MVGLNSALSIATEALGAQTAGMEVANNNIANVNTPGYSRQMVTLSSQASIDNGATVDQGVSYDGFTSVRDTILQLAINAATSEQGSLTTQSSLLSQINSAFSSTTSGIGTSLSTLFSDLSSLSTAPTDPSARQTVIGDANQLVNAFHQGAAALSSASASANAQVVSTVTQINQLSQEIAQLNQQLGAESDDAQSGGSLEDQRDALTAQLAQLVGVSSIQTGGAPMLTTSNGSPLVVGGTTQPLQVSTGADGLAHVLDSAGNDITTELTGGTLGGAIVARDSTLPALSQQLDTLASQFATAMNNAQATGYDLSGNSGTAMFTLPTSGSAAAGIGVALTSGSAIALSSDGSAGSSGNLSVLLGVQSGNLPSGSSPSASYATLVGNIGLAGSQVNSSLTAATASVQQLTAQQSSESGVSIDEETTNLLRYQQAYTAAARVISTINDCYTTLMSISLGD